MDGTRGQDYNSKEKRPDWPGEGGSYRLKSAQLCTVLLQLASTEWSRGGSHHTKTVKSYSK
jgi:hypothetical protein